MIEKLYAYGMRLRPFGIGCQPKEGFVGATDDPNGYYWNIILYSRELTKKEVFDYNLDYLGDGVAQIGFRKDKQYRK